MCNIGPSLYGSSNQPRSEEIGGQRNELTREKRPWSFFHAPETNRRGGKLSSERVVEREQRWDSEVTTLTILDVPSRMAIPVEGIAKDDLLEELRAISKGDVNKVFLRSGSPDYS